jgi:hypothetical protein
MKKILIFLFFFAISCSEIQKVEQIERKFFADFNSRDRFGISSLYKVCAVPLFNNPELDRFRLMEVSMHIVGGASANKRNQDWKRRTPIFAAIQFKNPQIVNFLLAQDADPRIQDQNGKSALDFAHEQLQREPSNLAANQIYQTLVSHLPRLVLEDQIQDVLEEKNEEDFVKEISNPTLKAILPKGTIKRFCAERVNQKKRRNYDSEMSSEPNSDVDITFVDNGKRIKREDVLLRLNQVKAKIKELCTF